MIRVCVIKNGVVENTIDYESMPDNPPPGFDQSYVAVASDIASIGWQWTGLEFTAPIIEEIAPDSRILAAIELRKNNSILLDCIASGDQIPSSWGDYRTALKSIAQGGDANATLPFRPVDMPNE